MSEPSPAPAMPRLRLLGMGRLLDPDGQDLSLQYRKGWALLGYLAVERDRRHAREQLASLFWPELGAAAARTNLRQVLADLQDVFRRLGLDGLIAADRDTIGLLPGRRSRALFDIDLLDPLIVAEDDAVEAVSGQSWHHAGLLLEGVRMDGCDDFEDWLQYTRQHFFRREIRLMERLRERYRAERRHPEAADIAHRLVRIDGWNEAHHRALMEIFAADGARHHALQVYAELERNLRRSLDCEPDPLTRALREEIAGAARTAGSPA
ncbi:hypothetical protein H0E84_00320 [Luteimonas sp. SJ-92]|uniref:Bacterial transcriptional activator domain-containing protein n=1 Tax=Luteimonas salinisoli TaxID=2752307 RepID=A0A853J829_9GAMM|nr:BTAD domain-containing putative transcriptional regulator [Luteimonas salinisoli]NZA24820.1 hypothetical protein [Luteimonas salinisoli]